jgi:Trypsin-co-occurring domain 1
VLTYASSTVGCTERPAGRDELWSSRANGHEVPSKEQDLRNGRRGTTSEIVHVMLPSGDPIWVRVQVAESAATGEQTAGPADVGLGERIAPAVDALPLRGFAETVRGVVTSVWEALDEHRPDSLEVEFGIEIAVRAGALMSVLAEVGGTAQVRVTASWARGDAVLSPSCNKESGPQ